MPLEKVKFFNVYSDPGRDLDDRQNVDCCFVAQVSNEIKITPQVGEISRVEWFSFSALPDKIAFDHRRMIEDYSELQQQTF